ncbi:MAG: hypothetical protein ACYDAC_03020 [Candidatus Dormibacteria bacterium]
MTSFVRTPLRWLGRHAIPALGVTLIAGAAAGGGITYALTSQPAAAASPATPAPLAHGDHARQGMATPGLAREVLALVVKDTGQSAATIRADLASGKSLDQVAGASATTLENDIVRTIVARLSAHRATGSAAPGTSTLEARVRTRVHALMAEPGTQLLKELQHLRHSAAGGGTVPAPRRPHATAVPAPAA